MKTKLIFILMAGVLTTLNSCAPRIPFSQEVIVTEKLSAEELKKIQFYNSHDVVLQRGTEGEKGKEISEGTLKTTDEKSVERVIIRAGTPGIVERVMDGSRLAVRFEEGEEKYLVFGDPTKQGRYTLLASEWDSNNRGKLQYGGKTYSTGAGAANVYLTFRMKNLYQFKKDQKVVKGMKL